MPLASEYVRGKKLKYFMEGVPKTATILEVGSGSGWLREQLQAGGWANYVGIDIEYESDINGDIRDWKSLGINADEFDVVIAFEVVEHVDCFQAMYEVLKPGGLLMLTSPVPHMDWACKLMELFGLNQKRTSPHDRLIYFKDVPLFEPVSAKVVAFIAQWGIFRKPALL